MDSLFKQYEGIFQEKEESSKKESEFKFAYSPFALQDAIGERSAKKAWLEYQKLRIKEGILTEELIHKIISKTRDMLAISLGADKESLNIKNDYPFNKSKKDAKNWPTEKLKQFYTNLISAYHRSRLESGIDLDTTLEKLILNI